MGHFVASISPIHRDELLFCGAVFLLCCGLWSLKSGTTLLFHRMVKRSDDALLYWIGVLMTLVGGIALMIVALTDRYHRMAGR